MQLTRFAILSLAISTSLSLAACDKSEPTVAEVKRPTTMPIAAPDPKPTEDAANARRLAQLDKPPELGEEKVEKGPDGELWTHYASGIYVHILKPGNYQKPRLGQTVHVTYVGTLPGSKEPFDQSLPNSPFTFELGTRNIIKGWNLALANMTLGSKWRILLPPELAYGKQGAMPKIMPNQPLIFEIQLLKITGQGVDLPPATEPTTTPGADTQPKVAGPKLPATVPAATNP